MEKASDKIQHLLSKITIYYHKNSQQSGYRGNIPKYNKGI